MYLAVGLGLGSLGPADALVHGDLLQEGVALGLGEVRRLHLAEVELHGAVVADDVGEEGPLAQGLLADLECHGRIAAILEEGHHHFLTLEVLRNGVGKHF